MYIIRKGEIAWKYEDASSKGEISDGVVLSNGNILFAHQFGVTLISPDKKFIWNYDAPAKTEIHTAQPIGKERVLFIQNGDPAKLIVINIVTNKTEKEYTLTVANAKGTHGQFRHARLTDAGTLLVAHMDMKKSANTTIQEKRSGPSMPQASGAQTRLKNGNTLMSLGRSVREVDASGKTVWEFTAADIPDYKVTQFQAHHAPPRWQYADQQLGQSMEHQDRPSHRAARPGKSRRIKSCLGAAVVE